MRIEIAKERPPHFKEAWPGQFDIMSHMSSVLGIPEVLCAITTVKENGRTNVCFYSGATFTGGGEHYYAVLPGLYGGHTAANIARTGEFVINFVSRAYYDACTATIEHNGEDEDEFAAGGFTVEPSRTVACPRIGEAFICVECTLERLIEHPHITIGRVNLAAVDEAYASGVDAKYGEDGFMFNIAGPYDLNAGTVKSGAVAVCNIVRTNEY